jgi:excisionase family DNA binding protein
MEDRILLDKKSAAAALSISVRSLENLIRARQLAVRRVGRRTLIPRAALEAFARSDHPTTAASEEQDRG